MREATIQNATIKGVTIGPEDHGILTMFIHLGGAGWGVGFGGYAMDDYDAEAKRRRGHKMLAESVIRLCEVFGVSDIYKLVGLPCRAETEGWGGRCLRIGHFLENRWFSFEVLAAELRAEELTRV